MVMLAVLGAATVGGCASAPQQLTWRSQPPYARSIFGPAGLTPEAETMTRATWPAAQGETGGTYRHFTIYFRESLRPGTSFLDDVYRRVDDRRTGYAVPTP